MTKTYPTKNDLPEATRKSVISLLNQHLADAIHLNLQTKQAHWNVKGPHFMQLHLLFDQVYEEVSEWVDTIAERSVQLGGTAEGTLQAVTAASKLPAYSLTLSGGRAHIEALSAAMSAFGKSVRAAIETATRMGDADTADLFTGVSRGADKMLWFLESHGQSDT
jgi:starvation-inducible DNA-binding protein